MFRSVPAGLPTTATAMREMALDTLLDAQRGWRQFIDVPVPHLPVTIRVGGAVVRTRADRSGYIDVVVRDHGLGAGWHDVVIDAAGADKLLGKGDMLFFSTRYPRPLRLQAPFITEESHA